MISIAEDFLKSQKIDWGKATEVQFQQNNGWQKVYLSKLDKDNLNKPADYYSNELQLKEPGVIFGTDELGEWRVVSVNLQTNEVELLNLNN